MKTARVSTFCLVVLLFAAPMLRGQDLSNYRAFSLGAKLSTVLRHTDQKLADVKLIYSRPVLVQELTWWPANLSGAPLAPDAVEQMLFSFYDGELYKISVIYDRTSTQGLTPEDMVKSVSARYGPAKYIALEIDAATNDGAKPVASWEDSQYFLNLVRSSFTSGFELIIYSKKVNAKAELALTEAVKLEQQERLRSEGPNG